MLYDLGNVRETKKCFFHQIKSRCIRELIIAELVTSDAERAGGARMESKVLAVAFNPPPLDPPPPLSACLPARLLRVP